MNYFYILLLLLFTGISAFFIMRYWKQFKKAQNKNSSNEFIENNEFETVKTYDGDFYFFHTTWCPHCKDAMPLWDELVETFQRDNVRINFIKVDCDKDDSNLSDEFNVTEYPTYILVIKNKKFIYDADLNVLTMNKFFESVEKSL